MNRIMGIDHGEKRIGIALSDPLQMIANPHAVIPNDDQALPTVLAIAREYEVERIVIGHPINLMGRKTLSTERSEQFREQLQKQTDISTVLWDERMSTKIAGNVLLEANVKRNKRKQVIDKVAAVVILQSYLDSPASKK